MKKAILIVMTALVMQFCGPSERDIAIQRLNACLTWNTKEACEAQLGMRVMEYNAPVQGGGGHVSSFIFWHNGGYYYPYGTSYYYMGSTYPTSMQMHEVTQRYGNNYSGSGATARPHSATPVARADSVRVSQGGAPLSYTSRSSVSASNSGTSRGGFGSRASFYGGGIS